MDSYISQEKLHNFPSICVMKNCSRWIQFLFAIASCVLGIIRLLYNLEAFLLILPEVFITMVPPLSVLPLTTEPKQLELWGGHLHSSIYHATLIFLNLYWL
jgi:hypothetical protein